MQYQSKWISRFRLDNNKPDSWVFIPSIEASLKGLEIKNKITQAWNQPEYFFHLMQGGHVAALKSHIHHSHFIKVDLSNFFGNVNKSKITRSLKSIMSYNEARAIAQESTVILPESSPQKFILPFGFIQSPIIASVCLDHAKLGSTFRKAHTDVNVNISVYMDDIIISSNDQKLLNRYLSLVEEAAEKSNFPLNPNKTIRTSSSIIAFNIELSQNSLKITPERMDLFFREYINSKSEPQKNAISGYIGTINIQQANLIKNLNIKG